VLTGHPNDIRRNGVEVTHFGRLTRSGRSCPPASNGTRSKKGAVLKSRSLGTTGPTVSALGQTEGLDAANLARRVQVLEDRDALRGLMLQGWRALDRKDWQTWIDCWAEDAVFEFGPWGTIEGRQAIRDKVVEAETPYQSMQHHIVNMHFDIDGDRATGFGYMWFVGVVGELQGNDPYAMGGPYEWEYVRTDQGWRLAVQRLGVWWTQGRDAVGAFDDETAS
jgi:ketosteroid isomerase-like protein